MSARAPSVAHEKELLILRSALCRLRLQRATRGVRGSVSLGLGRTTRFAMLVGRVVVFARIARSVIGFVRASLSP